MQNFIHDDQKVVAAPLSVVLDDVGHDAVDLVDDLHFDQFIDFNLSRSNDRSNNLDRRSIELGMSDLKVLEQHRHKLQLPQNHNERLVPLNND